MDWINLNLNVWIQNKTINPFIYVKNARSPERKGSPLVPLHMLLKHYKKIILERLYKSLQWLLFQINGLQSLVVMH